MNKLYTISKIICLLLFTFGASHVAKAQIDTIPPKMKGCGDTIKVQRGSVFILVLPAVSDNMTDSADIMVSSKWGSNGAVNTSVDGLYTLTITAFDTSGNVMRCIRYYKVGDFIPPANVKEHLFSPLKVFPSPANNLLNIQLLGDEISSQIIIFASNGQVVYDSTILNTAIIDTNTFSNGIYSLMIRNSSQVHQQTLVIQH